MSGGFGSRFSLQIYNNVPSKCISGQLNTHRIGLIKEVILLTCVVGEYPEKRTRDSGWNTTPVSAEIPV